MRLARRSRSFAGLYVALVVGALVGCGGSEPVPPSDPVSVDPAPPDTAAPAPTADKAAEAPNATGISSDPAGAGSPASSAADKKEDDKAATPPPEPAKTADPPAGQASAAGGEVEGTIASRKGSILIINTKGAPPAAGAKGSLLRYFEQKVGPFNTSGWLGIADVTVKSASGDRIELTINAEKSVIVVDGKKVDHFAAGNRVKIELTK